MGRVLSRENMGSKGEGATTDGGKKGKVSCQKSTCGKRWQIKRQNQEVLREQMNL